jgi:enoyl-CoA hydratase/carnithine racemase
MDSRPVKSYRNVIIDDVGITVLEICRPEKKNALSQSLTDDLVDAISVVENTGLPKVHFQACDAELFENSRAECGDADCDIAGADLGELAKVLNAEANMREYLKNWSDNVYLMRKPIVVAVIRLAVSISRPTAFMNTVSPAKVRSGWL